MSESFASDHDFAQDLALDLLTMQPLQMRSMSTASFASQDHPTSQAFVSDLIDLHSDGSDADNADGGADDQIDPSQYALPPSPTLSTHSQNLLLSTLGDDSDLPPTRPSPSPPPPSANKSGRPKPLFRAHPNLVYRGRGAARAGSRVAAAGASVRRGSAVPDVDSPAPNVLGYAPIKLEDRDKWAWDFDQEHVAESEPEPVTQEVVVSPTRNAFWAAGAGAADWGDEDKGEEWGQSVAQFQQEWGAASAAQTQQQNEWGTSIPQQHQQQATARGQWQQPPYQHQYQARPSGHHQQQYQARPSNQHQAAAYQPKPQQRYNDPQQFHPRPQFHQRPPGNNQFHQQNQSHQQHNQFHQHQPGHPRSPVPRPPGPQPRPHGQFAHQLPLSTSALTSATPSNAFQPRPTPRPQFWSTVPGAGAPGYMRGGHTPQLNAPRGQYQQFGPAGMPPPPPLIAAGFHPRPPRPMGQQQQGWWQQAGTGAQAAAAWNASGTKSRPSVGHGAGPAVTTGPHTGVNPAQARAPAVQTHNTTPKPAGAAHAQRSSAASSQSSVPSATSSTDAASFSSNVSRDPSPLADTPTAAPEPAAVPLPAPVPVKPETKEIGVDTEDLEFTPIPGTKVIGLGLGRASSAISASLGLAPMPTATAKTSAGDLPPSHLSAALGRPLAAAASPVKQTAAATAAGKPPTTAAPAPASTATSASVPARGNSQPRRGAPTQFLYSRTHLPVPAWRAVASQHHALLGDDDEKPASAAGSAGTPSGAGGAVGRGAGPAARGGFRPGFQAPFRGRGGFVGPMAGRGRGAPFAGGSQARFFAPRAMGMTVGSKFSNPKSSAPLIHTLPLSRLNQPQSPTPTPTPPAQAPRKSAWKGPVKYIEFDAKPASTPSGAPTPADAPLATATGDSASAAAAPCVLSDDEVSWTSSENEAEPVKPASTVPSVPPKISAWKGPVYIHPPVASAAAADWPEEDEDEAESERLGVDVDASQDGGLVSEGDDEDGWSDVTDRETDEQEQHQAEAQASAVDVGWVQVDESVADDVVGQQGLVDRDHDQHLLNDWPLDAQEPARADSGPPVTDLLGLADEDHAFEVSESMPPVLAVHDAFWQDEQLYSPPPPSNIAPQNNFDVDSSQRADTDLVDIFALGELQRPYRPKGRARYTIERRVLPSSNAPATSNPPSSSSPAWNESTPTTPHDQQRPISSSSPASPPRTSPSSFQYRGFNSHNPRSTWNGPQARPGVAAHDLRPFAHNIKPLPLIGLGSSLPASGTLAQEESGELVEQHPEVPSDLNNSDTGNKKETGDNIARGGGGLPFVPVPPTNPKYGNRPFYGVPRARPGWAGPPAPAQSRPGPAGVDVLVDDEQQQQHAPSSPPVRNGSSPSASPRPRSTSSSSFTRHYQDYRSHHQRADDDDDSESVDLNLWSAGHHRRMQSKSRPRTEFSLSLPEQTQDGWEGTSRGSGSDHDDTSDAASQEDQGPILLAPRPPRPRFDRRTHWSLHSQYRTQGAGAGSSSAYRPQLTASMSSWIQPKAPTGGTAIQRHQRLVPTPRPLDENGDHKPLRLTDLPYDILHLIVSKYAASLAPAPFFLWAPSETSSSHTLAIPVPTLSPGDCSCVPWWAATDDPERRWPYPTHLPPIVPDVETLLVVAKAHPRLMTACLPFMARHVQMPATEMQLAKRQHGPWLVTIHSQQWAMSEGGLYLKSDLTAHPFDRAAWVSMPIRSLGALRLDCVKPEDPETFTFRLSHVLGHATSLRDLTLAIPDALLPTVLTACSQRLVGLTLHSPHPSDALLQLSCARWPKLARLSLASRHVGTGPPPEQLQKPEGKLHLPMVATVHLDISKMPTYFLDHIAQAAPSMCLLHINFNAIQGGYPENQLPHHLDGFRAQRLRQLTLGGKFPMRSLLEMWPFSPNLYELVLADQDMEQHVSLMVVWTKFPRITSLAIRKLKLVGLYETVLHLSRFQTLTRLGLGHNVVFATMTDSAVLTPPVPAQGLPVIKSLKILEANATPALAIAARAPCLEKLKIHSPGVAGAVSHDVPIEQPLSKFISGLPVSLASSTPSSSTSSLPTTTTAAVSSAAAANPSVASSPSRVGPSELASLVMPPTGRAPMTLNLYGLGCKVAVLDPSIVQLAYARPPPTEFDPEDPYGLNQSVKRLYSPWPMTELSIHTTLLPFLSPTTLLPQPVSSILTSLTLHSVGSRWTRKPKSAPRHSGSSSRPIDRAPFAVPPPDAFPALTTLKFVGTITATEPPLRLGPSVIALAWDVSRRPEGKVTIEGTVVLCRASLDHGGASILDLAVPLRSSQRKMVRWLRRVTLVSPMITQVHLRVPAYPWLAPGEYSIMWSDEREAAETESLCAWIRKVAVWASKCHLYVHLPRGMRLKGIIPVTPLISGVVAGPGSPLASAGGGTSPVVGNAKGKKKASGAVDPPVVESIAVLGATGAQVKFVPYDP